jgi:RNA polymerase sigma factor (sigma-70 family)
VTTEEVPPLDEGALRALVPRVLAGMVRRGEDFDTAEDALQDALLEALRVWPEQPPRDPRAWLTTVATRRLVDARRSQRARQRREETTYAEPRPQATEEGDDTLFLLFCCAHRDLMPASQVALTLRAVGGLTTREIGRAVAVGHVIGPAAGLRETDRLRDVIGERHRWHAVRGYLLEFDGDLAAAAASYAEAARRATNVAERDLLVREAARARSASARVVSGPPDR